MRPRPLPMLQAASEAPGAGGKEQGDLSCRCCLPSSPVPEALHAQAGAGAAAALGALITQHRAWAG